MSRRNAASRTTAGPLRLCQLEDRTTPATFTVTTDSQDGPGSLREAVALANTAPDADTILFAPKLAGRLIQTSIPLRPTAADVPQPAGPTAYLVTRALFRIVRRVGGSRSAGSSSGTRGG